jgi:hypothetical protein
MVLLHQPMAALDPLNLQTNLPIRDSASLYAPAVEFCTQKDSLDGVLCIDLAYKP